MNIFICSWIVSLSVMLTLDSLWLFGMTSSFYKAYLGHLFAHSLNYAPVIVFYLMYTCGLSYIVITPSLNSSPVWDVFLKGAIVGCMAYGAYDLTNHATLKAWPLIMTIVDMVWGSFVTAITSAITFIVIQKLYI